MIDISYIINDEDFSTEYNIKRVSFSLEKGRLTVKSIDDIKIRCAIIPNINQTRRMSDFNLEHIDGKIGIFCTDKLYGMAFDKISDNSIIDFILYDNVYWQIEEIRPWKNHGYIIAYAKMYETQTVYEELDNELHPNK